MLNQWESMPKYFITSSQDKRGRKEMLDYIGQLNEMVKDKIK